jgi:hypothetical protein
LPQTSLDPDTRDPDRFMLAGSDYGAPTLVAEERRLAGTRLSQSRHNA